MKIAFVCAHFPPHFRGGTEVVALAQARALARRGHEVSVVAGTDRPRAADDVERALVEGLSVAFLPRASAERQDLLQQVPRLTELLVREVRGSQVIHLHHGPTLPADAVRALSRVAPVVLALNDFLPVCPRFFRTSPDPAIHCPPAGSFEPCVPCLAPELGKSPAREIARGLIARSQGYRAE
ncbi:MAG: glycosyltransferase, partial [Planctomycetota bacterium]